MCFFQYWHHLKLLQQVGKSIGQGLAIALNLLAWALSHYVLFAASEVIRMQLDFVSCSMRATFLIGVLFLLQEK